MTNPSTSAWYQPSQEFGGLHALLPLGHYRGRVTNPTSQQDPGDQRLLEPLTSSPEWPLLQHPKNIRGQGSCNPYGPQGEQLSPPGTRTSTVLAKAPAVLSRNLGCPLTLRAHG
ncbi:hypothetical protein TREES_T100000754 [Tupaia chinensis]|uniref:Uncharacterized protein n=1 Tax=Tupaia chinensis TaxID=246437 RepID=L9KNK1_TUPCH|nr:hypothetical protein TREES_T100000754 [Tupaia chinensis]